MYEIIKGGVVLAMTEKPTYIRVAENGCYTLCEAAQAQGVAVAGSVYHLEGLPALEGAEDVTLRETDAGEQVMNAKREAEEVQATNSIAFVTLAESGAIDEVTASEHPDVFERWAYPVNYTVGQLRTYEGVLYKCIQAHTSQADRTPPAAVSLWVKTNDPAEEWPEWSQPVGAHDAYELGAQVSHNGKHWTSNVAANVWEPGVYGWTEVDA